MSDFICDNITLDAQDSSQLCFAGQRVADLAEAYGTPLYLMDEDRIRKNCRVYTKAFAENFVQGSRPLFASKACSFKQIYRIMEEEGMGIDVVSSGEIYTARAAGYDLSRAYFHGSNKTDADVAFAFDCGVGYFVADNVEELAAIELEAAARDCVQKVLLRVTPGIDPHTYEAINTGKVDSKFGAAIETGQALELTKIALAQPHISLEGFHCHVGSQVFAEDVFERAAVVMLEFIAQVTGRFGIAVKQLDLGGGYGVRYVASDPYLDVASKMRQVALAVHETCARLGIQEPIVLMEPGRSIVADAGMTVYTVGSVKRITGYKNYVSIDGGMTDNPRFALYKSSYTCLPANKMNEARDFECAVVGRCCESGDIIQENVPMPESVARGDLVAVCTTGAYNYSMASNYNRIPRPPVVMLRGEGDSAEAYLAVKRESFDDLLACDL